MADSENPFLSSFAADDPAPAEPIEPKPTDDQNPFLQTFGDEPAPAPTTNPVTEFFRSASRNLAPAIASIPAMGAGAEVGAALGAATGPAAPIAAPVLGIGGAIIGGIAGQQAVSAAQDWLIDQLPDSWQKFIGQSKEQMAKGQQEQPIASFAGSLAPFAITMRPGWGPAAPATNTAIARIMASPVTSHVVSGVLQGGMETATEAHEGEPLDPTRIAIATGFGLVFDKPTKLGERLTSIGASPVTAARRAANIPLAPHEMPPPEAEAPAEQAPTVAEANEANVMGPGVTEGVFMGTEKRTPETAVAAQKTVDDETTVLNPAATIPDPTTVAARMEPELFAARDDLLDTRGDLVDRLRQVRDPEAEVQPAESAALQLQINAIDTRLREMGPDIAAAHRRAADAVGSEVIEPDVPAVTGYTTAKGSTYEVHEDGTTTRNKSFHPEHGAEDQGPQPRSEATFYTTPDHAQELGLFQTQGGAGKTIQLRDDGTAGVRYSDGKDAGKFERRTVAEVQRTPAVGLIPVEIWNGGKRVHFGNPITEVRTAQPENAIQPPVNAPEAPSDAAEAPVNAPNLTAQQVEQQAAIIAEDVTRQLLAAGRPEAEAHAAGHLLSRRYVTRAARLGNTVSPEVLYQSEGATIRAGGKPVSADAGREIAQNKTLHQSDTSVDAVVERAKQAGVDVSASETPERITLSKIVVPKDQRSGGLGTKAMRDLLDYADANGKDIVLTPSNSFGGSVTRLRKFYKDLGFVENKGKSKDFTTRETMIRAPQQPRELFQPAPPIDTPEFNRWFGDSKVVDEHGAPLTAYHGSARDFEEFDLGKSGTGAGTEKERAIFVTTDPATASRYAEVQGAGLGENPLTEHGGAVYPVYVKAENPYISKLKFYRSRDFAKEIAKAKRQGHDSIMFPNVTYEGERGQIAVFDPTQIKSVNNRGTFDPKDPRILFQPTSSPSALQAHMDSAGLGPEQLADFGERVAQSAKSGGFIGGESTVAVMNEMRRTALEQDEVLDTIVGLVPVDVVNRLFGSERAAKVAFHDEAVLKDGSAFDAQLPVSDLSERGLSVRLLMGEVARDMAERSAASPAVPVPVATESSAAASADHVGDFNQGKRASITFVEGRKPIVKLFAEANASSFLHETGHQWLEELMHDSVHPSATDVLKDDAQTVRDWLGIKDIGEPIQTSQHEKFARTFEQYMREGVAPSAKLARVFAQFKTWLTSIYQTIKGLGSPINEDIRSVFDRMIETEPNRTVVAPERDVPSGITDLHEHEAETVQPKYAEPAMDRVLAERDDLISQQPTEVQNELARAEAGLAARAASPDAGAETGTGADGKPEVVADSGNSGPQPEGGAGSGERGALDSGGTETRAEGPGASAPSAGPDSGLRDDRPGAVNPVGPPAIAPDPATSIDRAASGLVDKAGNIRLDNINTPESIKQVLRDMAQQNNDFIDLRRGVIKAGQLQDLAAALGVEPDRLLARRVGQAFNGEEIKYAEKVLAQSAQDLAAAMKPGINATAAEVQAYASKMARHQMIQGQFSGLTAEAGRAFAALRRSKALWSPEAKAADLAAKQVTGKTLFQLKQEMALGAELDTPEKISKFANDANKPSFMDGVVEYWIGALLAGPKTLMVNDVSNMVMAVNHFGLDTAAAALSGRVRRALGREGSAVHLGEIGAAARSLGKAGPVALKASVESYITGKAVELPGQTEKSLLPFVDEARMDVTGPALDETVTYRTVMPEVFGLVKGSIDAVLANGKLLMAGGIADSPLVSIKGTTTGVIPDIAIRGVNVLPIGQIARRGFRALSAHDSFFRAANFTIEKARIGYRTALDEGLVPGTAAFDQRVTDVSSNMTPDQLTEATDAAAELTFVGKRGPFTQALVRVANSKPFGLPLPKFVVPFVATPLSIIERAISNRSPLAFLSPEVRADLMGKNGNVAQDMATGRLIMGTLYGVAGLGLVSMKLLNGSAPANSNDAAAWRMAGNQEHSVRVGDTWYQISQLGSVGLWLSMVADAASVGGSLSKGEWDSVSSGIMQAFYQNIVDMSSLTGVSDLMQAIQQSDRYGNQYVSKFLASFIPADVAQWNRWTDPYVRDARTILDTAKSRIPAQSETLPPRRDIWGDPIPQSSTMLGLYARQAAVDPINKVFLDAGYWPGTVDRKIRGVALTPQQYDEFSMLAGRMAKQQITARIIQPGWQQLPAQQKHDALQQVIKWSREAARNAIMVHYPKIAADATRQKMSVLSVDR